MSNTSQFVFRKQDRIGVADAQADKKVLLKCFIDTGDFEAISDFDRPERFILGRTGAGKTALVMRLLENNDSTIVIQPESLALGYVSNSTILRSISDMGVDLDIFFRLLWRHVLGVEILKHHFNIANETDNFTFLDRLKQTFTKNKKTNHLRALKYLEDWGSSFWKETDSRVKELTTTLESGIEAQVSAASPSLAAKLSGNKKITEEEKSEITHLSQAVVNNVQMKELTDLMKMLDDAIEDKQKHYYLIIDRLDDSWIEDELRYRLIKALIETVKDFAVVEQVKPLVVLRTDLINRVYDKTRKAGFQEEKYTTLDLPIRWTRKKLTEVLDVRVNYLVKQRYTHQTVTHLDFMPESINGVKTIDFIIDRTLMRPRDIIQFFNLCIEEAVDESEMSEEMILKAEREYSQDRLGAIYDEWYEDYPKLKDWIKILEGFESEFFAEEINSQKLEERCLNYELSPDEVSDKMTWLVKQFLEDQDIDKFRKELIRVFYIIGLLGVRFNGQREPIWSYELRRNLNPDEIDAETILEVQPCFWSALRIRK